MSPRRLRRGAVYLFGDLGVAITTQVCTAADEYSRASNGSRRLTSDQIQRRVGGFADELIKYAVICGAIRREAA
jgi:hypothetical protein